MAYLYVDVETVPLDKEDYLKRSEEERLKLLNPIDSRIIAIGTKTNSKPTKLFMEGTERQMLEGFWKEFATFRGNDSTNKMVGFNIKNFDLPVLVTRSLINNVKITPFILKEVVDLRDSISAFRYGATRGKLKEFATFIGVKTIAGMDGKDVAEEFWAGNIDKIKVYLEKDLEITESLHKRVVDLRIDQIEKW